MRYSCLLLVPFAALIVGCGADIPEPEPEVIPEQITIAEARATTLGTRVHVAGFVSVEQGTFYSSTGELGFAIQDDTGGIYVTLEAYGDTPQNAKVEVVGDVLDSSGQDVILTNYSGIKRIWEDKAVVPEVVATGDIGELTEGKIVRITGAVTKDVVKDENATYIYGFKAFVDDGSGEVQIYINHIDGTPLIDTTKLTVGAMVQITGYSSQSGSTYEIAPRRGSDLVMK